MESLKIVMGEDEPFIYANGETGEIDFDGRILTFLEVLTELYFSPFSIWFNEFTVRNISKKLTLNIALDYFSTSAEKVLVYPILKLVEWYRSSYQGVIINWQYPSFDDDILDVGQVFESLTELKFNYVALEDKE